MENGKCRRTHGMCVRRRMQYKTQLAADFSVISRESERATSDNQKRKLRLKRNICSRTCQFGSSIRPSQCEPNDDEKRNHSHSHILHFQCKTMNKCCMVKNRPTDRPTTQQPNDKTRFQVDILCFVITN